MVFRYEGTSDVVALWTHGEHLVEARGVFRTVDDLRRVLGTVVEVDVDTWLGALPASLVKPLARAAEVDAMLADIPSRRDSTGTPCETAAPYVSATSSERGPPGPLGQQGEAGARAGRAQSFRSGASGLSSRWASSSATSS